MATVLSGELPENDRGDSASLFAFESPPQGLSRRVGGGMLAAKWLGKMWPRAFSRKALRGRGHQ